MQKPGFVAKIKLPKKTKQNKKTAYILCSHLIHKVPPSFHNSSQRGCFSFSHSIFWNPGLVVKP